MNDRLLWQECENGKLCDIIVMDEGIDDWQDCPDRD